MTDLEQAIKDRIGRAAPSAVSEQVLIQSFQDKYPTVQIQQALLNLEKDKVLVDHFQDSNIIAKYSRFFVVGESKRRAFFLKDYSGYEVVEEELNVGGQQYPKMLSGDTVRSDDINFVIQKLAENAQKAKEDSVNEIEKVSRRLNAQLITLFGLFVSIFSIIVISTDKLITLDPKLLETLTWSQLLGKSAALLAPVVVVIAVFVLLIDWVRRK